MEPMAVANPQRKRKLTGPEFAARFKAEKALQQRRYCEAFALWRTCGRPRCRREQACCGDPGLCLRRALDVVPRRMQWQTRQDILERTPRNIGAPERTARQCMPRDFYEETTPDVVARYLAFR
jgi:hypothetical protein